MDSSSELADDELEASSIASASSTSRPGSVYSYHSSIDGQVMLKDMYGRTINNSSEHYGLPADPAEHARLDVQHLMLKTKLNGLFFPSMPVRRALAPRQTTIPAILDLGTGSGSWAIDMAKLFPHAEVLGLDLVPANLNSLPPFNCRFECDDINLGLLHYRNSFDIVHARCIALGIKDYPDFLMEIIEILRPGGVYIAGAGDMQLYNEDRSPVELPEDELDPASF
ncbi:hypothetical protein FRB90_004471 [Tulasnella sp. 427]|nr:hypothetical protein FRB90_004471 [Tulasnella sp. 427]